MGRSQGEKGLAVSIVITAQTDVTVYTITFRSPEIQASGWLGKLIELVVSDRLVLFVR